MKEYCNLTSANPCNAVYKLVAGKIRNKSTFTILKKTDDTYTTDLAQIMNYIIDKLTWEDKPREGRCEGPPWPHTTRRPMPLPMLFTHGGST